MPVKKKTELAKRTVVSAPVERTLLSELRQLIEDARTQVARIVDAGLTLLYWQVGHRIHTEVLGEKRADYGAKIVVTVSRELQAEFGRGFEEKNLRRMVQFAEVFPDREIVATLSRQLSWSHFIELIPLNKPHQRDFYFLDFLGLKGAFSERDLESAILRDIESFLVELGSDFAFVARQKRIVADGDDFYLDLLFSATTTAWLPPTPPCKNSSTSPRPRSIRCSSASKPVDSSAESPARPAASNCPSPPTSSLLSTGRSKCSLNDWDGIGGSAFGPAPSRHPGAEVTGYAATKAATDDWPAGTGVILRDPGLLGEIGRRDGLRLIGESPNPAPCVIRRLFDAGCLTSR